MSGRKLNYFAAFKLKVTDLTDQPSVHGLRASEMVEGLIAVWVKKETTKSMATHAPTVTVAKL